MGWREDVWMEVGGMETRDGWMDGWVDGRDGWRDGIDEWMEG